MSLDTTLALLVHLEGRHRHLPVARVPSPGVVRLLSVALDSHRLLPVAWGRLHPPPVAWDLCRPLPGAWGFCRPLPGAWGFHHSLPDTGSGCVVAHRCSTVAVVRCTGSLHLAAGASHCNGSVARNELDPHSIAE